MKEETTYILGLVIMLVIIVIIIVKKDIKSNDDLSNSEGEEEKPKIEPQTYKTPKFKVENNYYPASRIIAGIYVFLAYIFGFWSIIAPIFIIISGSTNNKPLGINIENNYFFAFLVFLIGMIITLLLVATSERIKIFIDIEHNTRKIAENQKENTSTFNDN
jgi:hypothetical protein